MVWRGWIVLIGFGLGGALLGLALAGLTPTSYESESLLVVVPSKDGGGDLSVGYARVFSRLADDRSLISPLIAAGDLDGEYDDIRDSLSVQVASDTPVIQLAARQPDPFDAARMANIVAEAIGRYTVNNEDRTGYRTEILTPALPPTEPASPQPRLNAVIGGSLGFVVGGLLILAVASSPRSRWLEEDGIDIDTD